MMMTFRVGSKFLWTVPEYRTERGGKRAQVGSCFSFVLLLTRLMDSLALREDHGGLNIKALQERAGSGIPTCRSV